VRPFVFSGEVGSVLLGFRVLNVAVDVGQLRVGQGSQDGDEAAEERRDVGGELVGPTFGQLFQQVDDQSFLAGRRRRRRRRLALGRSVEEQTHLFALAI